MFRYPTLFLFSFGWNGKQCNMNSDWLNRWSSLIFGRCEIETSEIISLIPVCSVVYSHIIVSRNQQLSRFMFSQHEKVRI